MADATTSDAPGPAATGPSDSRIDALRRVKEAETRWNEKLEALRAQNEAELKRVHEEAEAKIRGAQAEAEREREATVGAARREADREAEKILADGRLAAEQIRRLPPPDANALRPKLLQALVGDFAEDA